MEFVARAEDERQRALPRQPPQLLELLRFARQFRLVTAAELVPAAWIVAEPPAQLAARRELLHPVVDFAVRFTDAARPQPSTSTRTPSSGAGGRYARFNRIP